MDNPKKLATCGTQDEDKQNTTQRNWQHVVHKTKTNKTQHRETGNMWYTRRRQTKHNTKKLATCGTQDEDKQNKNNPEKLATCGTQDEDKQNKNTTQYVLDTTIHKTQDEDKQNKNTTQYVLDTTIRKQTNTNNVCKT
jgi:hypothetical protein